MADVQFRVGTWDSYNGLSEKKSNALYFITDRNVIYKGDELFGVGAEATSELAGLMSAADKQAFDTLLESANDGKIPTYALKKLNEAQDSALASYQLQMTVDGSTTAVGDTINIPKDLMLKSGELKYVEKDGQPYAGAVKGDPYLELVLNDEDEGHIYVPVKGLVDVYTAGQGIQIVSNLVSILIDGANANGLKVSDAGLALDLATPTSAGAMSAADKKKLDDLAAVYLEQNYEVINSTNPQPVVDYKDGEIRIMFKEGTNFQSQQVGSGGDSSRYYTKFIAYAPEGATQFKESSSSSKAGLDPEAPMENFKNNGFAGTDKQGRNYSNIWLPVAKLEGDKWTYFGASSGNGKFIGWYYNVEWYDADGNMLKADCVRISLSNEDCHTDPLPYYMSKYALTDDLTKALEWGNIED